MSKNMRLADSAAWFFEQVFGAILRRAAWLALGALFALIALYHFTVAGMVALSAEFGILNARLIVAGGYTAVAIIAFIVFKTMRPRKTPTVAEIKARKGGEPEQAAKIAMLVEALTLGYSLARKPKR